VAERDDPGDAAPPAARQATSPRAAARWARAAAAATALALVVLALAVKPLAAGDALEYLLQTESLARHGSPELRANDVSSLARQDARLSLGLNFAVGYNGYFDDPGGRWYACHFWAYSLLAAPARLLLAAVGLSGLRAFPLTNVLLLLLALRQVLFALPFSPRARAALALLLLGSPVLFFLRWPHAEAMTVAAVTLSLAGRYAGRPLTALLWAALASLQSPPFVVLLALLWIDAVAAQPRLGRVWRATLAAAPALLSPLFYLWRFGTPSLLARESASTAYLSPARAVQLFVDPEIGLVRAMPVIVVLLVVVVFVAAARARRMPFEAGLALAIGLMALASTPTANWNHGTIGPSRYAVWLVPCVLFLVVVVAERAAPAARAAAFAALWAALVSDLAITAAKGGPLARPDDLQHSTAARLLLRHAPALYRSEPAVFAPRTLGEPTPAPGLVVYEDGGRCRKALARAGDLAELRLRCGALPQSARALVTSGPGAQRYVDY
jgi:hypothetical protein